MRSRRLCMVVHGPYPVGEPRVVRETQVAVDAGYDVDVLAMRRAGEPKVEEVDGARVVRLPIEHKRGGGIVQVLLEYAGFTALASLWLARRSLSKRYDVVQIHNPPDFLVAAALVPRLLGARVVFDVHDLSSDMFAMRFEGRGWSSRAEAVLRVIERLAARFAHAVVTVHEPYRRELIDRGVAAEKLHVVMNVVDERLLPEPRQPEEGVFRVVYHGTVSPPYGVELLVEAAGLAAADIDDLQVRILGEGDAVDAVRRRADELGVADRVDVSGAYLPHRDVLQAVNGASVGVIPNLPLRLNQFALSSKLFEYVALGIPIVCSGLPTLREHFDDDELLFYEPGSAEGLADALRQVARAPVEARDRADRALRRYRQDYRWPVSASRYRELLDRLAVS